MNTETLANLRPAPPPEDCVGEEPLEAADVQRFVRAGEEQLFYFKKT